MNKLDLIGKTFGRLIVKAYVKSSKWLCSCSCGTSKIVRGDGLQSGKIVSCGCTSSNNLLGKRFGKLLVISFYDKQYYKKDTTKSYRRWLCRCDCGKEAVVNAGCLKHGRTKSCGCLKIEVARARGKNKRLPKGDAAKHLAYQRYVSMAKQRRHRFNLSYEECLQLFSSSCYYCGKLPSQKVWTNTHNGDFFYNGIDRLDNNKGYELSNCVSCCWKCNNAKKKYSKDDFLNWVISVYNHSIGSKNDTKTII